MEAFVMKNTLNIIKNFIGSLYRDLIALLSSDFIEYTAKKGYLIYKNIIPFNFTIGIYKFVKDKDFKAIISE